MRCEKQCEKNNPADFKVRKERLRGAPGAGTENPLQPTKRSMVKQVVPLRAHGGPHAGAGGYALKEAAIHGEPTLKKTPGMNYSPWRGVHAGTVWQELWPEGDPDGSSFLAGL